MKITKKDIGKKCIVNGSMNDVNFEYDKGIIISITEDLIGVKFNFNNNNFHSCDNVCTYGNGYFIYDYIIIKIINPEYTSIW